MSSEEEQIASALHDHSRDRPEKDLCLLRGKLESRGSSAQDGMWSGVTGTKAAWKAALFAVGFPPPSVFPASTQSCNSRCNDVML